MAYRRIRHQLLHVLLHERYEGAIDDRNDRERDHPTADFGVHQHIGKERQRETDEPVSPHLQQDASQDDRTRSGRFHMGIRQPGVEREHWNFDREGEEEAQE